MHLLSQKSATSSDVLLVAFGRRDERPDKVWVLTFGVESLHTIVRSGAELVFTAQEKPAPMFNRPEHWVVTLFFETAEAAARQEEALRSLKPLSYFQGDDHLTGIVARAGHSLQAIGVSQSVVDQLAFQQGVQAKLVSSEQAAHRDYYLSSAQ
jgi:hypothetical protein